MSDRPLGLIAAIPDELRYFKAHFVERERRAIAGLGFRIGDLDGRPVVTALAGMGKVNAAVMATLLLHEFGCRALIFSGIAGGLDPDLHIGDVVVARRVICHDYGALAGGTLKLYQPGNAPLPGWPDGYGYELPAPLIETLERALAGIDLPRLSAAATGGTEERTPRIVFGTVLSGDLFLDCADTREKLHRRLGGQAIEMEGAAIAQVAERFGVPYVIVRAVSDLAGAGRRTDASAFRQECAGIAAAIVRRLAAVILPG